MPDKLVSIEELYGWWIDYVVGQQICDKKPHILWGPGGLTIISLQFEERNGNKQEFSPHQQWADAGPLIERFKISLIPDMKSGWTASVENGDSWSDFSPLKAAMLALISSKVGRELQVPVYK